MESSASDIRIEQLRSALRRVAQPIGLLLVRDSGHSEIRGATVTSWLNASFDPPSLVVSVGKGRWIHQALVDAEQCSLVLLAEGQEHVAEHFSSRPGRERGVAPMRIRSTAAGLPTVDGSIATLECVVSAPNPIGDHDLFVLKVGEVEPGDGDLPLLWHEGAFAYAEPPRA